MPLAPGTRLGPYEIVSLVGAGGMGEVYKARDTRLDRTVAIKVLPEALAADPEFRERFDREARVISQLTHSHICALFDVGSQDRVEYLVLEYLEGETMAARVARGALKTDDAIRVATEIAEALAAAHRAGIVHRDLKPGNVMLTRSGVKLLDFGLAKNTLVSAGSAGHSDLTSTPTVSSPLTSHGAILGTFQYMAPEQIEGREADARSDIWAFGCILHELLTGRKPFAAKTQAGLIGAILERDPPALLAARPDAPRRLEWMIGLCLAKDPDARWQAAADVAHELRKLVAGEDPVAARMSPRRAAAFAAAGLALGIAAATLVFMTRSRDVARAPVRTVVLPAEGTEVSGGPAAPQAAISPDGTRIVFSALDANRRLRLYHRPLDAVEPRPIEGGEDGELPFWSPDGRSVGFFSIDAKLKTVALDGGGVRTVCDMPGGILQPQGGGTWSRDGVILFSPGAGLPIQRVSAAGGSPEPATAFEGPPRVRAHMWPAFLADGRRFLFLVTADDPAVRGIHLGSLGSTDTVRLVDAQVAAVFVPPNLVLFVRDGVVMAQPLDADARRLIGEPKPVAERVAYNPAGNLGRAAFTASRNTLVYRAGDVSGLAMAQLTWVDRKGAVLGTVGAPGRRRSFDLSPDETRVAVSQYDARSLQSDIWVIDVSGTRRTRVTSDPSDDVEVVWSPDGERLVFASTRRGPVNLYAKALAGDGAERLLFESPRYELPWQWSNDGRFLLFTAADPKAGTDLWVAPMTGDGAPRPLARTKFGENYPHLSRDGRWLAYTSDESGAAEIYVQPFPPSGSQWQVSNAGGTEPRWRVDGKELFYISASQKLMGVEVNAGATFAAAAPVELFSVANRNTGESNGYTVSRDGRFLIDRVVEQTGAAITVVVDWQQRLK